MHRWDQSLPRQRMGTTKRIKIALQEKGRIVRSNNAREEEVDEDSHILSSGSFSVNNEYTIKYIIYMHLFSIQFNIRLSTIIFIINCVQICDWYCYASSLINKILYRDLHYDVHLDFKGFWEK